MAGIVTGVLVALARIAGETAPLLFTAFGNDFWSLSLNQPMAALPLQIFNYAISPYDDWHAQAWAGALVLIALVLVICLLARAATRSGFARASRVKPAPTSARTPRDLAAQPVRMEVRGLDAFFGRIHAVQGRHHAPSPSIGSRPSSVPRGAASPPSCAR